MAKRSFPADNADQSARDLWYWRADYQINAYPSFDGSVAIKDLLFFERMYYGLIDPNNRSVALDPQYLKVLPGSAGKPGTFQAVDFVAAAFKDMKSIFDRACAGNLINKNNPHFWPLQVKRAYIPPKVDYEKHLKRLLTVLNTNIIPNVYGNDTITNFNDYVNTFINFFQNTPDNHCLTYTKWCRSALSSVFHSGLAIDIANLQIGSDQEKVDMFIDHPNFVFYQNAAINTGFSLMKNAPWILIADLQAPGIAQYVKNPLIYNFKNLQDLFDKRYIKTIYIERNILSNLLYRYYNFFTIKNPKIKKIIVCNNKTIQTYTQREILTPRSFTSIYGDNYWIDVQIILKNIEDQVGFSPVKIKNIQKRAKNLLNLVDIDGATSYIVKEYGNQTWDTPYGYDDKLKSLKTDLGTTDYKAQRQVKGGTSGGTGGSSY